MAERAQDNLYDTHYSARKRSRHEYVVHKEVTIAFFVQHEYATQSI